MSVEIILEAMPRRSALIVGDVSLDRWCVYDPDAAEPSRETGIPRVGVVSTEVSPGAGGTIANNLTALGVGRVALLGVIGEDGYGYELMRALRQRHVSPELLIRSPELPTFTYTKLINCRTGREDLPRIDFIPPHVLSPEIEEQVIDHLETFGDSFDVVFVSDQAESRCGGVVTPAVREALAGLRCRRPEKVVWADSRRQVQEFRHVVLKPNRSEADAACELAFGHRDYQALRRLCDAPLLFVTLGERGALVLDDRGETLVPSPLLLAPRDICGAGDSFSAGAAMALDITGSPIEAARFGNLAASITVMKPGTGTASPDEILAAASAAAL